ncbi:MBL fold metallo-hydrolase [Streptomyces sp. SCSIO 30461]|uniref:MBL fold metallo-hydrolase n=1 Tax=Streptomyces sp. SCSIO 30461 TaxID=3118085 RepID=UPI0030CFF692
MTEGVYQVRNLDLSNMTLIEGTDGVIVVDPLISAETAAAALSLYRVHRGDRPVTALIYTHTDHFGGAGGVLPDGAGDVPVFAPQGFTEHLVSENVYAGHRHGPPCRLHVGRPARRVPHGAGRLWTGDVRFQRHRHPHSAHA